MIIVVILVTVKIDIHFVNFSKAVLILLKKSKCHIQ